MIYSDFQLRDGPGIRTTVFLKGYPLNCLWCSNPESQSPIPQLLYFETHCTHCYQCIDACPSGAIRKTEDQERYPLIVKGVPVAALLYRNA